MKTTEEPEERQYTVTLSERQVRVIKDALDLYSRIGMGQLKEVVNILCLNKDDRENRHDIISIIRNSLESLSNLWIGGSGYHGITSRKISNSFRVAWDIQQVLRHRVSWDREPKGGITVNFDEPMITSGFKPPTIRKIEDG